MFQSKSAYWALPKEPSEGQAILGKFECLDGEKYVTFSSSGFRFSREELSREMRMRGDGCVSFHEAVRCGWLIQSEHANEMWCLRKDLKPFVCNCSDSLLGNLPIPALSRLLLFCSLAEAARLSTINKKFRRAFFDEVAWSARIERDFKGAKLDWLPRLIENYACARFNQVPRRIVRVSSSEEPQFGWIDECQDSQLVKVVMAAGQDPFFFHPFCLSFAKVSPSLRRSMLLDRLYRRKREMSESLKNGRLATDGK
jgi:hypothetical protein